LETFESTCLAQRKDLEKVEMPIIPTNIYSGNPCHPGQIAVQVGKQPEYVKCFPGTPPANLKNIKPMGTPSSKRKTRRNRRNNKKTRRNRK
jgi:hypothetical protein